jgi:hypothetical protein
MSTSWYPGSAYRLGGKQAPIGLDILPMAQNSGGPAINRHRRLVEMVGENSLLEPEQARNKSLARKLSTKYDRHV